MAVYLISYDLNRPGQNYESLWDALKKHGAKRALLSAWAINTTSNAEQIRDWVRQFIDNNDRVVVTQLTGWAAWNAMLDLNSV